MFEMFPKMYIKICSDNAVCFVNTKIKVKLVHLQSTILKSTINRFLKVFFNSEYESIPSISPQRKPMIYVLSDRSCRFVQNISLSNARTLLTNSLRTLILKLNNSSKFN